MVRHPAPYLLLYLLSLILGSPAVVLLFEGWALAAESEQQSDAGGVEATTSAAPRQVVKPVSGFQFYGEWGPIFLRRQDTRSATLVREAVSNATVLSASSLDLNWKTGFEVRAGVTMGDFGGEFRWFDVGRVSRGWSAGKSVVTPANWEIPTIPTLIGFPVAVASAGLSSALTNIEANLRWQPHRYVAVLAGVRNISLDDDLRMHFDTGLNIADVKSLSRNDLWGGQLGVQGQVPVITPDLLLGAVVKAAFLHNASRNQFVLVQQVGSPFFARDREGQNTWAFELGMDIRYNIFSVITVSIGYQALWLGRVAQATDQISRFNVVTGGADVNFQSVWFHGPRAAIVIRLPL